MKLVEKKEKTMNHVFVESSEEEVDPVNVISQNIEKQMKGFEREDSDD